MTKPTLFIDGEAGTTGLEIRKRIANRSDIEIISISPDKRKDVAERARLLNESDLSILCLPDAAAKEAVALITNPKAKIIDASTAHRIASGWTYGFPELTPEQADHIRSATRVSNPGCYPTGAVALLRPLVDAGVIPASYGITVNAISGYSGGGKDLIAACESGDTKNPRNTPFGLYGLDLKHKHVPEMRVHAKLAEDPIFTPSYSNAFYRGMLIQIALRLKDLSALTGKLIDGPLLQDLLVKRYMGQKYVTVAPLQDTLEPGYVVSPLSQNDTNNLQLQLFWNSEKQIALLTACLDNLGKGASGAAVQNMDLMLGLN